MRTIAANASATITITDAVDIEVQDGLSPEELGIRLKEAARDNLGLNTPGYTIDLDEITIEDISLDGKALEFYDPRHIRVEYDENFTGGDYDDTGDFAYIPLGWIEFFGNMENAFEHCTGFKAENIIHYVDDTTEYYTADGEEYEAPWAIWEGKELTYSPATYRFNFHGKNYDAVVKAIANEIFYEWEAGFDAHTSFIIEYVGKRFSPDQPVSRPIGDIVKLTSLILKYLKRWKEELGSQTYGPNDEETHNAAEKILLLCIRYLFPEWVTIEKHS